MKEIIEKITSYNLFNYLLPGVLFVVIIQKITNYKFEQENMLLTGFVSYFIGMVISRTGSLFVEKVLIKAKFIVFKDYKDFVAASHKDSKLEVLSEQNNTYRTIIAMLVMVVFAKGYEWLSNKVQFLKEWDVWILFISLIIMFLFAYKKQTKFISDRIDENLKQ